ncbi:MAG: hypothetical protein AAFU79_33960, partial [Myxococcota bacterium]
MAFLRKHAADLEEESRKHVSAEASAEQARQEELEEQRRKVQGYGHDSRRKKRGRRPYDEADEQEDQEDREAEARAKELV